jgi:hypothetical protein
MTIGSALQDKIKHPTGAHGVSILPSFLMVCAIFLIASFVNYFSNWTGTWCVAILFSAYIIYGILSTFSLLKKKKESSSNQKKG